ncbi:Glu/Leu/Phe/Val dehydrogenase dimerization domain-containing protein [Iamia majanohamensis]|uniref:Glu/Leu/Phe/Val dehydrogenase dimerization domain-containing protein n=1 Tax=Iamia majanohamensis TaxID=467976 RepID=A0AAF0BW10_9ACTN|nr:Glu/Leu/Phe/Val dehydrogenase dimerization domain-containing protein [Iamia majanohamensis]WCO67315.1 Glu/Leu/Phe/Val dehydrogenase dimerization domain-containing protein [Iamia majanohamensis]
MTPAPTDPPAPSGVFAHAEVEGFEQVAFCHHGPSGLRAIVAIHSTALGPALGGTRFRPYATEADAVADVCRLARGMTYKHAVSGLDAGGGKAVILGDPRTLRSEALVRAYARFIDGLGGRYLTAEDVGTTQADMDLIRTETPHVTGVSEGLGGSGDPSPATAWGVACALQALADRLFDGELAHRHVVVSGVGKVGAALVDHLVAAGARVTVADVDPGAVEAVRARHPGVGVADAATAHTVACDVFSPCALGAVLSARTIPALRCAAVCGSANNQLEVPADGVRLVDAGVLYAPDFVVNAGGVINIAEERHPSGVPYDRARAWDRVAGIATTLGRVLDRAAADGTTPAEAADRLAEERIAALAPVARLRTATPGGGTALP